MMLLSNFSSFLEIITGVYISMCMDDVLKGLWSPKYYKALDSALKEYYLQGHGALIERIVETNTRKAKSLKKYMKNRALFFFVTCLMFLLLSGYENTFILGCHASYHMTIFFMTIWIIILLFFNGFLFCTKQKTVIAIILLVVLSSTSYFINYKYTHIELSSAFIVNGALVVLVAPILWQAFVCWMFSSAYKGYIRNKLKQGKENYQQAERGLMEHNPNIIPKRYKDIYTNISIQSNDAEQAKQKCLDHYLELMENEITEASDPKSGIKIFVSWLIFHVITGANNFAILMHLKKRNTIIQQQS